MIAQADEKSIRGRCVVGRAYTCRLQETRLAIHLSTVRGGESGVLPCAIEGRLDNLVVPDTEEALICRDMGLRVRKDDEEVWICSDGTYRNVASRVGGTEEQAIADRSCIEARSQMSAEVVANRDRIGTGDWVHRLVVNMVRDPGSLLPRQGLEEGKGSDEAEGELGGSVRDAHGSDL